MAGIEIQCVQCGSRLNAESVDDLRRLTTTRRWEPYGIRVSVGVAAAEHHDEYSCYRCATETPHRRLTRLMDAVFLEARIDVPYDIMGGALDTVIAFHDTGERIPVVSARRDTDLADSIAAAIIGR